MLKNTKEIMDEQFKRRSIRYKLFFIGLLSEKYLFLLYRTPNANKRAILLRDYYFMMRYIDDIVDKDIILGNCSSSSDIVKFLEEKLSFAKDKKFLRITPKDEVETMIIHCQEEANELGFSMQMETEYIIKSLLFDAKRFLHLEQEKEFMITDSNTLEEHFYNLDIIGTISGCLKIYNEDPALVSDIMPLGIASRKYYNIRDFIEDIRVGLINISSEDINKFGITQDHINRVNRLPKEYEDICEKKGYNDKELLRLLPSPIIYYLNNEIHRCEENLNIFCSHREELNCLHKPTKITLDQGFSRPIINYLNLTMKNNK